MGQYFDNNVAPMANLNWTSAVKIPEYVYCKAWNLRAKLAFSTAGSNVRIRIDRVDEAELPNRDLMQGSLDVSHFNTDAAKMKITILKRRLLTLLAFPQPMGFASTFTQYMEGPVRTDDNNVDTIAGACMSLWQMHRIDLADKMKVLKDARHTTGNLKYADFSYSITKIPRIANARRYDTRIFTDLLGALGNRIVAIAKFPRFFRPEGGNNSGKPEFILKIIYFIKLFLNSFNRYIN